MVPVQAFLTVCIGLCGLGFALMASEPTFGNRPLVARIARALGCYLCAAFMFGAALYVGTL